MPAREWRRHYRVSLSGKHSCYDKKGQLKGFGLLKPCNLDAEKCQKSNYRDLNRNTSNRNSTSTIILVAILALPQCFFFGPLLFVPRLVKLNITYHFWQRTEAGMFFCILCKTFLLVEGPFCILSWRNVRWTWMEMLICRLRLPQQNAPLMYSAN